MHFWDISVRNWLRYKTLEWAGWNIVVTPLGINIKDSGSFRAIIVTNHCGISPRCTKISIPKKTTPYVLYIYDYCSSSTLCLVGKWVRSLFDVVYLFTSRSTVVFKSINSSTFDLRHAILIYFRIVLAKENSHFSFQWSKIKVC